MNSNCTVVNDRNFFIEVHQSDQPVVVAFIAQWCGLGHIMESVINRVAPHYLEKIKFCKIESDSNPTTIDYYGIHALPTVLVLYRGMIIDHNVGAVTQDDLMDMLNNILNDTYGLEDRSNRIANQKDNIRSSQTNASHQPPGR